MRVILIVFSLVSVACVEGQFWKYPQGFIESLAWSRKGRTNIQTSRDEIPTTQRNNETTERIDDITERTTNLTTPSFTSLTTPIWSRVDNSTETVTPPEFDEETFQDTSTPEMGTTEEPRDNHRLNDFYLTRREKPQVKIASNISQVS